MPPPTPTVRDNPLLAAVHADPADDTLRLAFADWLDEHDDPLWAEFIRLCVRKDPAEQKVKSGRANRMRRRWTAEYGLPYYRCYLEYDRGFISRPNLHRRRIQAAAAMLATHPLRGVCFPERLPPRHVYGAEAVYVVEDGVEGHGRLEQALLARLRGGLRTTDPYGRLTAVAYDTHLLAVAALDAAALGWARELARHAE